MQVSEGYFSSIVEHQTLRFYQPLSQLLVIRMCDAFTYLVAVIIECITNTWLVKCLYNCSVTCSMHELHLEGVIFSVFDRTFVHRFLFLPQNC